MSFIEPIQIIVVWIGSFLYFLCIYFLFFSMVEYQRANELARKHKFGRN